MEQSPQDPTESTRPAPQPAGPALGQPAGGSAEQPPVAPAAPRGPVTLLSKVAGISILLLGFALTDIGGHFVGYAAASSPTYAGIGIFIGLVMVVLAIVEMLGGIGILLSKSWGRIIGTIYSLLLGVVSLRLALIDGSIAWKDAPTWFPAAPNGIVFGPVFVLYAYSAIVLVARWRGFATTRAERAV